MGYHQRDHPVILEKLSPRTPPPSHPDAEWDLPYALSKYYGGPLAWGRIYLLTFPGWLW